MSPKNLHPSVIATSVLSGVFLSGILARKGAISAGHDPTAGWPFPDLTGWVIFAFGALACPILSVCLVKLLSRILPKSSYRVIFATVVIPPLIAFPMGAAAYRWRVSNLAGDSRKAADSSRIQRAKSDALQAQLISDPEIALRERWFDWKRGNEMARYLFTESLKEPRVPYTPAQLSRIYQEAPEARVLVVAHPACDSAFLADHWSLALNEAEAGNDRILIAIASNPKTPKALLENLESSSLLSHRPVPDTLKHVLDLRLHRGELVIFRYQQIQVITKIGLIKIHASSDLRRSGEWKSVTRSATLEARKESSPDGPVLYFYGFSEDSGQHPVTKRIEFREGRKSFQTADQVMLWIRQQSGRIPTVYRNDGLLVSCDMDPAKNQLTVEVWQILINSNKPSSLPGGDDTKITFTAPDSAN